MNDIKGNVKLTAEVVGDKSVKDISFEQCAHPEDFETDEWQGKQYWIENLEGLQYAVSARMIDIAYTSAAGKRIADLSPISGLTQLEQLILKQDGIDDISAISGLVNLQLLDLSANQLITDVSAIADMKKLKSLNLSFNQIQSVEALSNLESLEYIAISDNIIDSLPDLSKLTKVYFLDISHNQLTDISALAGMKKLEQLNLSGNNGITDITPLAKLIKLDPDSTFLPESVASEKDNLFAAIEVNKIFNVFNISKMRESDINNVQKALQAYNDLTAEQKLYFDSNRIEAAKTNLNRIQNGLEPEYYPEYDEIGEKQPNFKSVEISVVDKDGNPMPGIEFNKTQRNEYSENTSVVTTDNWGTLVFNHTPTDAIYDEVVISVAGDEYVAIPESIRYSVMWGNETGTVNGQPATGLEELRFVLISKDEYADKTELSGLLEQAESVGASYKYTTESYAVFEKAFADAKLVYADDGATKDVVQNATDGLKDALNNLEKMDILTELHITVKDKNGNLFAREFKYQIRVPVTHADAWNVYSDPYTSLVVVQPGPGWEVGKTWEITACNDEPYTMEPLQFTIGERDGQRYIKTVNGVPVDADYTGEVVAIPREGGAINKPAERKPDSIVLQSVLEEVKALDLTGYTTKSIERMETAIADAEVLIRKSDVTQEDYNVAVAELKAAKNNLSGHADKTKLQAELNKSIVSSSYISDSWEAYQLVWDKAKQVYDDENATQAEVDAILAELIEAFNNLVLKSDKTNLQSKIDEANALNEEKYEAGFDVLQKTVAVAQGVCDYEKATQAEVDEQIVLLQDAIDSLIIKEEVEYDCIPSQFRAKVVNEYGMPVSNVKFEAVVGTEVDGDVAIVSDANGVISYLAYGPVQYGKTTYVRLADDRYTTEDEHYFTVTNKYAWASLETIDGKAYESGLELTYVVSSSETDAEDIAAVMVSNKTVPYANGVTTVTVKGTKLDADDVEIVVEGLNGEVTVSKISENTSEIKFRVVFPSNLKLSAEKYTMYVGLKGQENRNKTTIIVNGINTISAEDALKFPEYILDVRDEETIKRDGMVSGSTVYSQFSQAVVGNNPVYILDINGTTATSKIVEELLEAGIDSVQIHVIVGGTTDRNIKNVLTLESAGWRQDANGWWYENEDGSWPSSTWKLINNKWYYFNAKGYRVTGWNQINGTWYYFDKTTGIMAADQWVDGDNYYVGVNGAMKTGWIQLDNNWYYLAGSGKKVTGWVSSKGVWYFMNKDTGIMETNKWVDGNNYYVGASGAMHTGWLRLGRDWYYFNTSGKKAVNQWKGNYYLKADGTMAVSEWVDNNKYYVGADGEWVPYAASVFPKMR